MSSFTAARSRSRNRGCLTGHLPSKLDARHVRSSQQRSSSTEFDFAPHNVGLNQTAKFALAQAGDLVYFCAVSGFKDGGE
jgi:hypothetical protein